MKLIVRVVTLGVLLALYLSNVSASAAKQFQEAVAAPGSEGRRAATNAEAVSAFVWKPGDQMQQLAGDLGAEGNWLATFSKDRLTVTVTDLCVRNLRTTTANDVNVELWVSKQIPTITGNQTHLTAATAYVGTIQPGALRCVPNGILPATWPLPDTYWFSYAIFEGIGASKVLQAIMTVSNQFDAGGPTYAVGGTLYFEKPVSRYITNGGNTASLQLARIRNEDSYPTEPLRIGLRASVEVPRFGQTLPGWTFMAKEYGPLARYSSLSNVDTGSLATTPPPAGTYWITAFLWQLGADGTTWYYNCIYTFPDQYTFTGAAPAPIADFSFTPTSPQVGQVVTFTDVSSGGPTSWSWSFGDGGTSSSRNPTHSFASPGAFNVTLTASNTNGSNSKTKTVTVTAPPSAPVITYFTANPPAVSPGQQTTLTWTSTGGTSATIDQGIGAVATSGSKTITPTIGVPYKLTVAGPGGSTSATVTIAAVPSSYAGTWLLPSSARASGQNAFWTTDLVLMNSGSQAASVNIKFLGHDGRGATGPERIYAIPPRATLTFPDVLSLLYGKVSDWGPILIRSSVPTLVVHGQTWTASPTGGSYGQSVPALGPSELVGASPKGLAGLRQDAQFRTNIVLANVNEASAAVTLQVFLSDGTTATTQSYTVGPLGFLQLNLASNLGLTNLTGGSVLVSCSTPGCQIAAYASVIDAATADPRTILAR